MKKVISTPHAPQAIGPYSQGIDTGALVFASGQIPLDPTTGTLVGEGNVKAQAEQVMKNVTGVLEAAGLTLGNVVKTTIFLKNMSDFAEVNAVYGSFFKEPFPARSTVEVARLPRDVLIEVEVIAQR